MGKGGQKISKTQRSDNHQNKSNHVNLNNNLKNEKNNFSLEHLSIEELQYWATAYAIDRDENVKKTINNNDDVTDISALNKQQLLLALEPLAGGILDSDRNIHNIKNLPLAPPPFTLGDIIKSIPKHCFKHSYITSFSYLLSDLMMVVCFFYLAHYCDRAIGSSETAIPPPFTLGDIIKSIPK